jgi:hypothetical protein
LSRGDGNKNALPLCKEQVAGKGINTLIPIIEPPLSYSLRLTISKYKTQNMKGEKESRISEVCTGDPQQEYPL